MKIVFESVPLSFIPYFLSQRKHAGWLLLVQLLNEYVSISTPDLAHSLKSVYYNINLDTPHLWRDLVKILTRKLRHTSSFSLECTDFKNVIFEKIHWAHSKDAPEIQNDENSK